MALKFVARNPFAQKTRQSTRASIDSRPLPTWFAEAKLGIFNHWGYRPQWLEKVFIPILPDNGLTLLHLFGGRNRQI